MAVRGGSQCGYCTPGFVCSMAAEFYRSGRAATNGTGARATTTTATTASTCTPSAATCAAAPATGRSRTPRSRSRSRPPTTSSPRGVRRPHRRPRPPSCTTARRRSCGPADLAEALQLLHDHEDATVVAGSTDWGVDVNLKGARAGLVVAVDRLPELRGFTVTDTEARIGAGLTLTEVERRLDGRLPLLLALMPQFASPLIRNGATLGGNLGTGSPIGDAPPVLLALEASVVLASTRRGAHRPAGGLLHRLPRVRTPPGRADHRGGGAAAGAPG